MKAVNNDSEKASQFMQNYGLKARIKKFKQKGKDVALNKMKQIDNRDVFYPINVNELNRRSRILAHQSDTDTGHHQHKLQPTHSSTEHDRLVTPVLRMV